MDQLHQRISIVKLQHLNTKRELHDSEDFVRQVQKETIEWIVTGMIRQGYNIKNSAGIIQWILNTAQLEEVSELSVYEQIRELRRQYISDIFSKQRKGAIIALDKVIQIMKEDNESS